MDQDDEYKRRENEEEDKILSALAAEVAGAFTCLLLVEICKPTGRRAIYQDNRVDRGEEQNHMDKTTRTTGPQEGGRIANILSQGGKNRQHNRTTTTTASTGGEGGGVATLNEIYGFCK